MGTPEPVRIVEESHAFWRVVFEYPPFNVMDAAIFDGLQRLLARMDDSPELRVVVFESALPDYYLAHFDLARRRAYCSRIVGVADPDRHVRPHHQEPRS